MTINTQDQERLTRLIKQHERMERWQKDPVSYMHERLGISRESIDWSLNPAYEGHRWDGTENPFKTACEALVDNKWVGIRSAVAVGKTFWAACIAVWFFECFPNATVVTTAPKSDQLELHIWKEIGKLHEKFPDIGKLGSLRLRKTQGKDDWIITGFVAGVRANEESTTKAQGFHAQHMLIILEETVGVPQPTINALVNTSVAPHNLILALGNPDSQLDTLSYFCNMSNVKSIRISAYDHPNIVADDPNLIPGATSRADIARKKEKLGGEDNPMYQSRVRGIAPAQSANSMIMLEWCHKAKNKQAAMVEMDIHFEGDVGLGVDVANSENGDLAAIARGAGVNLLSVETQQCPNANELGHQVYRMIADERLDPSLVGVDGVGVGAGTVNTLYEHEMGIYNILSGAAPVVQTECVEDFNNLRSQMWWAMREDLRSGEITLPDDEELFADLVTPRYRTANGRIVIEAKDEIRRRLGRSPNKGDAAVYWNWTRHLGAGDFSLESVGIHPSVTSEIKGYV